MTQPSLKAGSYAQEPNVFSDFNTIIRFMATKKIRKSLTSPPLAKDVPEMELIYDATLNRLYTKNGGVLKYTAFS
jgi:hypothetical protein